MGSTERPVILDVVDEDMCIACGACLEACPADTVTPAFSEERGVWEVQVNDRNRCLACNEPCADVCPSVQVNLPALAITPSGDVTRPGPIEQVRIAWAPEHQHNGVSSSGGLVRLLAQQAIESGTPVLCLGSRENGGYGPIVLNQNEDLARMPGSIYHSTDFTAALSILRCLRCPARVIAIPCQLEGMMAYIRKMEPDLDQRIELRVGLICGWTYTHHALKAFASLKGMEWPITDAQYRGEDRVGLLKLTVGQTTHAFKRREWDNRAEANDYRACFGRPANRMRCRVCEDHLNVLADISVGDAWLQRVGRRKVSLAVARSARGRMVYEGLLASGRLYDEAGGVEDLIESQSADLVYGHTARHINRMLSRQDRLTPRFVFAGEANRPASHPTWRDRLDFAIECKARVWLRSGRYVIYRRLMVAHRAIRVGGRAIRWLRQRIGGYPR